MHTTQLGGVTPDGVHAGYGPSSSHWAEEGSAGL